MKKETGPGAKGSFTGTSESGDFGQALADAIKQAEQALGTTDPLVRWKLKKVYGQHGGIAGFKEISVTISVE